MNKNVRVLLFDIETSYSVMAAFSLWNDGIPPSAILQDWNMITASWKWLDKKRTYGVSLLDDPDRFAKDRTDDYHVVSTLRDVVAEADIIIGHNSDKFDIKKLNTRILANGLDPLPPVTSIDTLKVAKKEFGFTSNRLDYISKFLGFEGKLSTETGLWMKCLQGNKGAIRDMLKYNKVDVEILEQVYLKLRPFMKNHPNMNVFMETDHSCPNCGSLNISKNGKRRNRAGMYQRYLCGDCGASSHSGKSLGSVEIR